ncbi:MAG TPA: HlyD family type I secretion periplasmic adaptor subunit [Alphaproteobacteria bacterium]|jgi:HlyD family type I secretion membrane fusion protein
MMGALSRKVRDIALPGAFGGDSEEVQNRYVDFLPAAQGLVEKEHSPLARVLLYTIAAAFVALVAWMALSVVEQTASAQAQVRPAGRVKVINHPEGGRVTELYVQEGDQVKAGQTLLELDPDVMQEDVDRLQRDRADLLGQVARLEAEALGDEPAWPAGLPQQVIDTQTRQLKARREAVDQMRQTALNVVQQRQTEVGALQKDIAAKKKSQAILKEQENSVGSLANEGYFPKLQYLTILRQLTDMNGSVEQAEEQLRVGTAALAEAQSRLTSVTSENLAQVLSDLSDAKSKLNTTEASLAQQTTRRGNLAVKSPDDGIVQNLTVYAVGQAIAANEPMMRVVPVDDHLILEARVSNSDIGYIHVGMSAKVKVQTYDFAKFGSLDGIVKQIAADASIEQQGQPPTFVVQIVTEKNYVGNVPGQHIVYPGMLAQVDMVIDKRSILAYLTERVRHTTQNSFRER